MNTGSSSSSSSSNSVRDKDSDRDGGTSRNGDAGSEGEGEGGRTCRVSTSVHIDVAAAMTGVTRWDSNSMLQRSAV
jgi:hypothetical protein